MEYAGRLPAKCRESLEGRGGPKGALCPGHEPKQTPEALDGLLRAPSRGRVRRRRHLSDEHDGQRACGGRPRLSDRHRLVGQLRAAREDRRSPTSRLGDHRRNLGLEPGRGELHHRLLADRRLDERVLDLGLGRTSARSTRPTTRSPTPTNLTTAVSHMETAYTDAAGRPTPDFLELGSGNIGGQDAGSGALQVDQRGHHPDRRHDLRRRQRRLDLPDLGRPRP